jgi:hypothetical protein
MSCRVGCHIGSSHCHNQVPEPGSLPSDWVASSVTWMATFAVGKQPGIRLPGWGSESPLAGTGVG